MKTYPLALTFTLALGLVGAGASFAAPALAPLWESEAAFKVPESVRFDAQRRVLYVSNVDGKNPWAKDGAGSIGRLGLDGAVIEAEWITGLDAPKGMALRGKLLYVADLKRLATIDVEAGKIVDALEFPEAGGLNDVTVAADGVVYVTDSKAQKIYRVEKGVASVLIEGLTRVNGALADGGELFYLDNGALYRCGLDGSGARLIADGLDGHADGVERVDVDTWLVSCWAGVSYLVRQGEVVKLLDTREAEVNAADLGYDPATRTVYLPTFWKNSVQAFELE